MPCPYRLLIFLLALTGSLRLECAASEADDLLATVLDAKKEADERIEAAGELGDMGEDAAAAVPKLIPLIHDKTVGAAVIEALGDIGEASAPAVPELVRVLSEGKKESVEEAVWALGGIGPGAKAAVPDLVAALDKPELVVAASWSLGMIGAEGEDVVRKLSSLLQNPETSVRKNAIFALGRVGPQAKEALPLILPYAMAQVVNREDRILRKAAVEALVRIGLDPKDAVPLYLKLLADPDWTVHGLAVDGLGNLGHAAKDAAPALAQMLREGKDRAASKAYSALQKVEPDEGVRVAIFMELVRTRETGLLGEPLRLLKEIGAGALAELMQYAVTLEVQEVEHPEDSKIKAKLALIRSTLTAMKQNIQAEAERLRKLKEGKAGQAPNDEDENEEKGEKDAPPAQSAAPDAGAKAVVPPPAPGNEGE